METVTYPYAGRNAVKNNDQARTRAKQQLGKNVLISHIGWAHEGGDTQCVVEYLTGAEAAACNRAPMARKSVRENGCRPADVHNALLEMDGSASIHDVALALDVDVQWLTVQMERPEWQLEVGATGGFAGEFTSLRLDLTTALPIDPGANPAPRRRLWTLPALLAAAIARSMMHS